MPARPRAQEQPSIDPPEHPLSRNRAFVGNWPLREIAVRADELRMAPTEPARMQQCPTCGYFLPDAWTTCKRCETATSRSSDAASPYGYSSPTQWSPTQHTATVTITTTTPSWRQPSTSLITTAVGFVLVLAAVFALPWMHIGTNIIHFDLSYKQMQDALSASDFFSRVALDLGPLILVGDLIVVGWSLATRGKIGTEAIAAPIGLAFLTLYVTFRIHSYVGTMNNSDIGTAIGLHANTGTGPWICLLGCACLILGAITGSLTPHQSTEHHTIPH
jgi:hypothetical protein